MKNLQKGFTLIELMIVVAIIAILAAIAIPQYQTYVIKSQVTRAMGEAGDLKVAVEDCINNGGSTWGTAPCIDTSTSSDILNPKRPAVNLVAAGAAGTTITATFGNHANSSIANQTVVWTRSASGAWVCSATVNPKYAPASCPGTGT